PRCVDNGGRPVTTRQASLIAIAAVLLTCVHGCAAKAPVVAMANGEAALTVRADRLSLRIVGLFFETAAGRTALPPLMPRTGAGGSWTGATTLPDGRDVRVSATRRSGASGRYALVITARPDADIIRWGFAVDAAADEYFTGLMERVVDGPQQRSWAPGITAAMNLRGQRVDMLVKPTTSVYAP